MPKAKRTSSCRKNKSYDEIKRHWGDVEVVDAEKDLRVFIQPEDVNSATAKHPGCCVFAQACKRQFAATKVLFWKSVAYVELPGVDGKKRVERFQLGPNMRELIENFDKGMPVAEMAGFELKKPRPSYTLDGLLAKNRASKQRRRAALIKGTRDKGSSGTGKGKGAYSKPAIVVDLEVRDGKGRVQFTNTTATS